VPEYRHPRARDDVAGHPPASVTLPTGNVAVTDGTFEASAEAAGRIAAAYDLSLAALRVGDTDATADTCETVKADGDVCGRELPCPYHD